LFFDIKITMPELSLEASHKFWSEYHDKMIYRVVTFMESVESWTLDNNPALEQSLTELGRELDDIADLDVSQLGHEEAFVRIAGNVKFSRALRLLQGIDTVHPGSASKLLMYAEENSRAPDDPAGLFLRRNIVFERLRLLGRVFAKDRMKLILKALEG
jgi:intracellular multiplication protein IcmW